MGKVCVRPTPSLPVSQAASWIPACGSQLIRMKSLASECDSALCDWPSPRRVSGVLSATLGTAAALWGDFASNLVNSMPSAPPWFPRRMHVFSMDCIPSNQ